MISKNLGKCFDAAARPDKIALFEPGDFTAPRETSYAAFDAECDAVARGLVARASSRRRRCTTMNTSWVTSSRSAGATPSRRREAHAKEKCSS